MTRTIARSRTPRDRSPFCDAEPFRLVVTPGTTDMICTSFFFEGQFKQDDPEYAGKKLFSSALVPCADKDKAYEILQMELNEQNVRIISIEEQFVFDPSNFDLESRDSENIKFISIYEEVKKFNRTIFTPFQLFDDDPS